MNNKIGSLIITKKEISYSLCLWTIFAILTVMAFHYNITYLEYVDIPTHFLAGVVIAAILTNITPRLSLSKIIAISLFLFILWEFIEIGIAHTTNNNLLFKLFQETNYNRYQDMVMDILGLLAFLTWKRYTKCPIDTDTASQPSPTTT